MAITGAADCAGNRAGLTLTLSSTGKFKAQFDKTVDVTAAKLTLAGGDRSGECRDDFSPRGPSPWMRSIRTRPTSKRTKRPSGRAPIRCGNRSIRSRPYWSPMKAKRVDARTFAASLRRMAAALRGFHQENARAGTPRGRISFARQPLRRFTRRSTPAPGGCRTNSTNSWPRIRPRRPMNPRAPAGSPSCCLAWHLRAAAQMAYLVRNISRELRTAVADLSRGAEEVAGAAAQVSSSSQSLAHGASSQAASLEETSASSEEIRAMATAKHGDHARCGQSGVGIAAEIQRRQPRAE